MVIRDWNNKMLGGFICKDGKISRGLHNPESNKSHQNARPAAFICGPSETYVYGTNYTTGGNQYFSYSWTYSYSSFGCIWVSDMYASFTYANNMDVQVPNIGASSIDIGPSTGMSNTYDRKFNVMPTLCQGYSAMLRGQVDEGKEMYGAITSDDKLVVLPSMENTAHTVSFSMDYLYTDIFGRPLIYMSAAAKEITVYYYQTPDSKPTAISTFAIKGFVHTHPMEDGYNWNEPSPNDITTATNEPGFLHYVVNDITIMRYDESGLISAQGRGNTCGWASYQQFPILGLLT